MSHRTKKFFVITPFGNNQGTEAERDTYALIDGLRTNILRKAEARCRDQGMDVLVYDGRDNPSADDLWKKIAQDISRSHGIIAVIATPSPNAYIELGVAFGLWFKPIILQLSGAQMPSDLEGIERIIFTREQALGQDPAEEQVRKLAGLLDKTPPRPDRETPPYLPRTTASDGRIRTYDRFSKAITPVEWSDILWEAEHEIILAAPKMSKLVNHAFYSRPPREADEDKVQSSEAPRDRGQRERGVASRKQMLLIDILTQKVLQDGVHVTVIFADPSGIQLGDLKRPMAPEALQERKAATEAAKLRWFTFKDSLENQKRMAEAREPGRTFGDVRVIAMSGLRFPYRVTFTDKRMLLTLRFHREMFDSRFCVDAAPVSTVDVDEAPLYHLIQQELDTIVEENGEASEHAFEEWRQSRGVAG